MRYFVSAADASVAADYRDTLDAHGYRVTDEYDEDCVVLSIGGDGSILYNGRRYDDPTILPIAGAGSEANTIEVDEEGSLERLSILEDGVEGIDYRLETHRKLVADSDDDPIRGGFTGLNDVHLHHADPVRAAKFTARVIDAPGDGAGHGTEAGDGTETGAGPRSERPIGPDHERTVYEADRIIGDGLLVATPFGSSGYYRSITGGTFETGIGVAFNNVHKPVDAPRSIVCSPRGRVELSLLTTTRSSSAVLARDDDPALYELRSGERISISLSNRAVEIVRFDV